MLEGFYGSLSNEHLIRVKWWYENTFEGNDLLKREGDELNETWKRTQTEKTGM